VGVGFMPTIILKHVDYYIDDVFYGNHDKESMKKLNSEINKIRADFGLKKDGEIGKYKVYTYGEDCLVFNPVGTEKFHSFNVPNIKTKGIAQGDKESKKKDTSANHKLWGLELQGYMDGTFTDLYNRLIPYGVENCYDIPVYTNVIQKRNRVFCPCSGDKNSVLVMPKKQHSPSDRSL
jgi:hypothetical protein